MIYYIYNIKVEVAALRCNENRVKLNTQHLKGAAAAGEHGFTDGKRQGRNVFISPWISFNVQTKMAQGSI